MLFPAIVAIHTPRQILLHIYPLIDNKTFNFLFLIEWKRIFLSECVIPKKDNGYGMLLYCHE